ncbi:gas vesicle protein GvpJ [Streptomyces sp. NPDC058001]|uniref:gas vesicle protein GvpJ n=1 Tax=Streptomyces sp. NPDC058001 TaxID=3346300 RepID=UPI0036E56A0C
MTVVPQTGGGGAASPGGASGSLYDILDLILDRGLVIDAFVRVSLVGIEILKIDARVVIASVDTYLRFAEACNRLDLEAGRKAPAQLPDVMGKVTEGGAEGKSKGAVSGAIQAVSENLGQRKGGADEAGRGDSAEPESRVESEPEREPEPSGRETARRRPARRAARRDGE